MEVFSKLNMDDIKDEDKILLYVEDLNMAKKTLLRKKSIDLKKIKDPFCKAADKGFRCLKRFLGIKFKESFPKVSERLKNVWTNI